MSLYLASQSPRRRELLQQIGVGFTTLSIDVDESPLVINGAEESAPDLVSRLAELKSQAGAQQRREKDWPILGADTVVCVENQILGKPNDAEQAADMLRRLSGNTHQVLSAVCLSQGQKCLSELSITQVSFRDISEAEIARYGQTGEAMGKAGGYAIQGLGALFVTQIEGSYSGVVGLPLEKLFPLLQAFGVPYWQS